MCIECSGHPAKGAQISQSDAVSIFRARFEFAEMFQIFSHLTVGEALCVLEMLDHALAETLGLPYADPEVTKTLYGSSEALHVVCYTFPHFSDAQIAVVNRYDEQTILDFAFPQSLTAPTRMQNLIKMLGDAVDIPAPRTD